MDIPQKKGSVLFVGLEKDLASSRLFVTAHAIRCHGRDNSAEHIDDHNNVENQVVQIMSGPGIWAVN
ncbi:hypothetical protein CEB3_c27530 [Peptococcaceae bacterium CEB3]|nr:hypothetical protein CEB3_c27530 [Peptococcaceae bacterium CEB3]